MNKVAIIAIISLLFSLVACTKETPVGPTADGKPNVVLIIADDMGWDAFGKYPGTNGLKAKTPVLDSLAQSGITFPNLWVNPECSPTRASIFTGKYGFRTGVGSAIGGNTGGLNASETLLQKFINDKTGNQYATAVIGKWHMSNNTQLAAPEQFGVDYYSGIFTGTVPSYFNWTKTSNGQQTTVTTYATTYFVDDATRWVKAQQQPWFLTLALNAPHTPFHRPPLHLISDKTLADDAASINSNKLPYYLAAIEAMDTELGRFFRSLTEEQKSNTLIIFIGDNGTGAQVVQAPYTSYTAKGSLWQGGINAPMIVSGYGVDRQNTTEHALVNGTDLYATIAYVAGAGVNQIHDGYSLQSLFSEPVAPQRKYAYSELFGTGDGREGWTMRDSRYKLIHLANGNEYFYDLSVDPFETANLLSAALTSEASAALSAIRAEKLQLQ
ncbi:sulfatase-like hydrolase/transferase [Pontibacter sp. JH31]|uniref:Sulfatase-like hydrolase/transferase n=1 Tax=Pontibacter aquaedesilientis TaxID=2766980 RepID=A0ABR7XHC3_9BACT|nr:sulfatase-like hydrolase/transferase [Pontibacter aquaedesilientis]